jgi:hypothetical protein
MSVLVQLPDGQKTHFVQEPDGVRNLHMQVPNRVLFQDDLSAYTGTDIVSQHGTQIGSWRSVPTRKGGMYHAVYKGKHYIHSDTTGGYATAVEAVPWYGLSFNQNKLRVQFDYYLRDGTPAVIGSGTKNVYKDSFSCSCYCASGQPYSGIQLFLDNPTLAHTKAEMFHRVQIISYNKSFVPNVEYTSSNTAILSNGHIEVTFTVERLTGNIVEVSASFRNGGGVTPLFSSFDVNPFQFSVDDNIYKQNAIIFEMKNSTGISDVRLFHPKVDNPDHA